MTKRLFSPYLIGCIEYPKHFRNIQAPSQVFMSYQPIGATISGL